MGRKRKGVELTDETKRIKPLEDRTPVQTVRRTKGGRLVSDFFWSLLGQPREANTVDGEAEVGGLDTDAGNIEPLKSPNANDQGIIHSPDDYLTYEHDFRKISEGKREARFNINQEQKKVCTMMCCEMPWMVNVRPRLLIHGNWLKRFT